MRTVWWALAIASVAGCNTDDFPFEGRAAQLVRELDLLEDVPVRTLSREQLAAEAATDAMEISDEDLAEYADTYGRLGFFDRDLDLRPILSGSATDWVGATYSPRDKLITLVGESIRADITVHEWVHALQDQHFDLLAFDDTTTSDAFLARRAIVEGDATLAQYRYIAVYDYGRELNNLDWASALERNRETSVAYLEEGGYPPLFLDYVSFVYPYGLELTAFNLTGLTIEDPTPDLAPHDWRREDALFVASAPVTTQTILDLGDSDPVVPIGLETVPAELEARFEVIDWDSLGEWYSYLLFFPLVEDARAIARGWDGDRVLFVRDRTDGTPGTLWASSWDDETVAQRVVDMMWARYGRTPLAGQPDYIAMGDDGELAWVERRGTSVVAARNLPMDAASALVDAAFAGPVMVSRRKRPSLAQWIMRSRGVPCLTVR